MNIAVISNWASIHSIGKIAWGLTEHLCESGHNAKVFYGRSDPMDTKGDTRAYRFCTETDIRFNGLCTRILGAEGFYSKAPTKRLLKQLDEFKPDAVYIVILHGYYINFPMLFEYLSKNSIKTIYLMLDEYAMLGKCPYSFECDKYKTECGHCAHVREYPASLIFDRSKDIFKAKQKAYDSVKDITFVGIEYVVEKAKESALLKGRKYVVMDEAVDLRNTYYPRETKKLREKLGIPEGNKIIVTVAPYSDARKGCKYFLEAAKRLEEQSDISFVHVGYDAEKSNLPKNYIPISYVADQNELAEYYSLGDLFVCTSLAETIPASCLEALSCGTKILGFNITGMPYCADKEHGTFVKVGDSKALADEIVAAPLKTKEESMSCRRYAESRYDAVEYREKLEKLLDS